LSGDRHSAEISKLDDTLPYPLFDVTSSAMNQTQRPQEEANPDRIGKRYFDENFGLLKIDWTQAFPQVSIEIRDLKGKVVRAAMVEFP